MEMRQVRSPLTSDMLAAPRTGRDVVQFNTPLTDQDFRRLGEWLVRFPEMRLRAYGQINDLEFLRHFPSLRRFAYDPTYAGESLDGLGYLGDGLEDLSVGRTKVKLDLSLLERFRGLKSLHLDGQTKHIEVLSLLINLQELSLRSITLPNLSPLDRLTRLVSLKIKLGGTKDISLLPQIGQLRYLEFWRVRGLSDVEAVGHLPSLRYLFLQTLSNVRALPDLRGDGSLRRVHLETMKGLRDLRPLATATGLEEISLVDMAHLRTEDLRPLVGLPRLRRITIGLGSLRRNTEAQTLFGLPDVEGPYDWRA